MNVYGNTSPRHENDILARAKEQVGLLREGQLDKIDARVLADTIELLVADVKCDLKCKLVHLLADLLGWEYRPELRRFVNTDWLYSIRDNRQDIVIILEGKPGSDRLFREVFDDAYKKARQEAVYNTGLALETFPEVCPYTQAQMLADDFFPGPPSAITDPSFGKEDYYRWTKEQASLLRRREFDKVDLNNVADDIEWSGTKDMIDIRRALHDIVENLLKMQRRANRQQKGKLRWREAANRGRFTIRHIIDHSASLKDYPALILTKEYADARRSVASETRLPVSEFPETCPWTIGQVTGNDDADVYFFPEIPKVKNPLQVKKRGPGQKGKRSKKR